MKSLPFLRVGSTFSGDALGRVEKSKDRGGSEGDKIDSVFPQISNSTANQYKLPVSPRDSLQSVSITDMSTDPLSLDPPPYPQSC